MFGISSDLSASVKNFQTISPESVLIMRVAHGLWSSSITLSDAPVCGKAILR